MICRGKVKNGVIVLEAGAALAEGTSVRVEAERAPKRKRIKRASRSESDALYDLGKYAVDTGIPDLAVNLDHYLYGHRKLKNGG